MAEINRDEVLSTIGSVIPVREYCEEYGNGLKPQSLYYAMDNDLVDWIQFGGREKYLVMTEKTKAYKPNENKNREANRSKLSLS